MSVIRSILSFLSPLSLAPHTHVCDTYMNSTFFFGVREQLWVQPEAIENANWAPVLFLPLPLLPSTLLMPWHSHTHTFVTHTRILRFFLGPGTVMGETRGALKWDWGSRDWIHGDECDEPKIIIIIAVWHSHTHACDT